MNNFEEKNTVEDMNVEIVNPETSSQVDEIAASAGDTTVIDQDSKEAYKQFIERLTVQFVIVDIPDVSRQAFIQAVEQLKRLKSDVAIKKEHTMMLGMKIRDKVRSLVDTGSIKIDEDEFNRSDVSVHQYAKVLDDITAEIDRDINLYESVLQKNNGETFSVIGSQEKDFPAFIVERTRFVKKYVKDVSKDLAISFSRFCFGFQSQMKRVEYVEFIVSQKPKTNNQELIS